MKVTPETARVREIRQLEQSILSSVQNANSLVTLLKELRADNETAVATAAMHSLRRSFTHLLALDRDATQQAPPRKRPRHEATDVTTAEQDEGAATSVYREWLLARFGEYTKKLLTWVRTHPDVHFRVPALKTLMAFIELGHGYRTDAKSVSGYSPRLSSVVNALLSSTEETEGSQQAVLDAFGADYVNCYDDVRYFMLKNVTTLAKSVAAGDMSKLHNMSADRFTARAIQLLKCVVMVDEQSDLTAFLLPINKDEVSADGSGAESGTDDDASDAPAEEKEQKSSKKVPEKVPGTSTSSSKGSKRKGAPGGASVNVVGKEKKRKEEMLPVQSIKYHRKVFADAWLNVLKLPLSVSLYKDVLLWLPEHVIQYMGSPLKLADFLTDSYNQGGINSVLALDALFLLMTKHNLEYPAFYNSLLKLLTPAALHARHRTRLFRILQLCLSSTHLSATAAAAFAKRLCRLALTSSPPAALFALTLTRKILDRHPQCMQLIRRDPEPGGVISAEALAEARGKVRPLPNDIGGASEDLLSSTSLWEIGALRRHYLPVVSTLAKGFAQKGGAGTALRPDANLAETYKSLFDEEMKRKYKETPVNHIPPKRLFRPAEAVSDLPKHEKVVPNGSSAEAAPEGDIECDMFEGVFTFLDRKE